MQHKSLQWRQQHFSSDDAMNAKWMENRICFFVIAILLLNTIDF